MLMFGASTISAKMRTSYFERSSGLPSRPKKRGRSLRSSGPRWKGTPKCALKGSRSPRQRPGTITRFTPSASGSLRRIMSEVISPATWMDRTCTACEKGAGCIDSSTRCRLFSASRPVRNRRCSGNPASFHSLFQSDPKFVDRYHHCGVFELPQFAHVFQIDRARIDPDITARGLGDEFGCRVAGKHDRSNAALSRLRVNVGRERVGNAGHALGHGVRGRGCDDDAMVIAFVQKGHRHCARGRVAVDVDVLLEFLQIVAIHFQNFRCRLGQKQVDVGQRAHDVQALLEVMAGTGECPGDAWLLDFNHNSECYARCVERGCGREKDSSDRRSSGWVPRGELFTASVQ